MIITSQQAFSRLASLCARREYCQSDMLEKMRQWGLSDEDQAAVMQKLIEGTYVDDERYAHAYVNDKVRYGKWGPLKIAQGLRMKHIAEHIVSSALGDVDDEDYLDVLRPLVRQKMRTTRAASDYELRMKVTKAVLSRGFTLELIRQCLDALEEQDEVL